VPPALTFPRSRRLTHDLEYQAVYGARAKKVQGPISIFAHPNDLPHSRLGLAIGKRAGGAVQRNHLKRLLREAFRLVQHDLPRTEQGGYDLVINAREHKPLALDQYQQMILQMAAQLHRDWERRGRK
jgi:ribonuclease P protein component